MCVSTHFKLITKVTSGENKEGTADAYSRSTDASSAQKIHEIGPRFPEEFPRDMPCQNHESVAR